LDNILLLRLMIRKLCLLPSSGARRLSRHGEFVRACSPLDRFGLFVRFWIGEVFGGL
jgi:hypothetical protein